MDQFNYFKKNLDDEYYETKTYLVDSMKPMIINIYKKTMENN